jgi:hypothetical protein
VAGLLWEKITAGWWLISQANRLHISRQDRDRVTVGKMEPSRLWPGNKRYIVQESQGTDACNGPGLASIASRKWEQLRDSIISFKFVDRSSLSWTLGYRSSFFFLTTSIK